MTGVTLILTKSAVFVEPFIKFSHNKSILLWNLLSYYLDRRDWNHICKQIPLTRPNQTLEEIHRMRNKE